MSEGTAHIGALSLVLRIPAAQSLKEKRRVLKSLKDRIRAHFNASVDEIGELDKWQAAALGVCMIGHGKNYISGALEGILSLVDSVGELELTSHRLEFL